MDSDDFIKEIKIIEKTEEEKELDLMLSIIRVKRDLEVANMNFEYATGDLIDYYIYQMKACRSKYDFLVKKAKELGLSLDMIEQIDIKYNKAI